MRTLDQAEVREVSGGAGNLVIDVDQKDGYVHINWVDGDKVIKIVNLDWSKFLHH